MRHQKIKYSVIFLFFIALFFSANTASAKSERTYQRYLTCLSNLRVINNTVEMYNNDHPTALNKYDEETEQMLINEHYLKGKMQKPENQCIYKMINGEIFCEYHGGMDKDKIKPSKEFAEILERILKYRQNQKFNYVIEIIVVIGFWLWIIFFLKDLFSKPQKTSSSETQIEANASDCSQDSKDEVQKD